MPQAILNLDLTNVAGKTARDHCWDEERSLVTMEDYRRFLALKLWNPSLSVVPSRDIDLFWHTHILYTKNYHEDCETVFGRYLHHKPIFGLPEEEVGEHRAAKARTIQLFQDAFGAVPQSYGEGDYLDSGSCCY